MIIPPTLGLLGLLGLLPIIRLTIQELRWQHRFKHIRAARDRDYDAMPADEPPTNP